MDRKADSNQQNALSERGIQNRMFVVGKDVAAEEGLRVVITDDGKHWDMNKAKHVEARRLFPMGEEIFCPYW